MSSKKVRECVGTIGCLPGPLGGLLERVEEELGEAIKKGGYTNLSIEYAGEWDDCAYSLLGDRDKTPKELELEHRRRSKKLAKAKLGVELVKEREYKEYLRLKAQFEGEGK